MHIYDFITDIEQANIKFMTQKAFNPERFEQVLDHYQQRFLQAFENSPDNRVTLNVTDKSKHLSENLQNDKDVQAWMNEFLGVFKSDLRLISKLMDDVIDCYYLFLRGRHHTAVLKMYDILERYEILDDSGEELLGLFFRCSAVRADASSSDESFYYHIPFNLRHLVKNQRFSVSGMPIWYGGASLICSYYEMRKQEMNEHQDIAISAWGFNPLCYNNMIKDKPVRPRTKVYDITNEIYDAINSTFYIYLKEADATAKRNLFSNHHFIYRRSIKTALRKFVLSNLCTFKSTKTGSSFYEEYVIPQLLTEAIRLHKYDGILFPSTQFAGKNVTFGGSSHINLYRSNLAMFTEHSNIDNYDNSLIQNFGVEVISPDEIKTFDHNEELKKTLIKLKFWRDFLHLQNSVKQKMQRRYIGLLDHLDKKIDVYIHLAVNGEKYLDSYAGKAELIGMISYLNFISKEIRFIFETEFEAFVATNKHFTNGQ